MDVKKMILIPMEKYHQVPRPRYNTSSPTITEETVPEGLNESLILQAIPKMYRNKAAAIVRHISNSDILQWNDKGEIIYQGQRVPHSHITDLLRDSQREYKDQNLTGITEFYQALAELNIPEGLIGHSARRYHVRHTKAHPRKHVTSHSKYKKTERGDTPQKAALFKKWIHL